ncbi:MAG: hypothetical protein P9L99_10095 [Candidatus Lernaella stagnicola]|nr:hypothetical protein [Candidatus Lernaella stagnicola]
MKSPHEIRRLLWLILIVVSLSLLVAACADSDDDDDDDGGGGYGQDIKGLYRGVIRTTFNSCPGEPIPDEEWFIQIEQSEDLSKAEVYWQEEGAGSEQALLFEGDVYGSAIVLVTVQKTNIGDADCLQVTLIDYRLNIDPETNDVFGFLNDDTFYLGAACSASVVDCRTERVIEPDDALGDDDTAGTDDDTAV